MATKSIRIGYVPEHYLLPLHLAKSYIPPDISVELVPFPSGTGHMITSLRSHELDLAIGLTEGWVAGLLTAEGQQKRGYNIVGSWVQNPLRWAIVTGRNRDEITSVHDLRQLRRVGVSRMGSGSHVMAFVLAQEQGWMQQDHENKKEGLNIVPLGPFKDLRDGVTGAGGQGALADFFMWEHFTTKPWFDGVGAKGNELKKIGEIYTPWPSWHIVANEKTFPDPDGDQTLSRLFQAFDQGVQDFNTNPDVGIRMLGTGELGCHYTEDDAREWLKDAKFYTHTRGVDSQVMDGVVKVLQAASVVEPTTEVKNGDGVVGIRR